MRFIKHASYWTLSVSLDTRYDLKRPLTLAMKAHPLYRSRYATEAAARKASGAIGPDIGCEVAVGEVFGSLGF